MQCPDPVKLLQLLRSRAARVSGSSESAGILADAADSVSGSVASAAEPDFEVRAKWRRRKIWQAANFLACLFFLTCAGFQFNDSDPHVWIPIYAIPGFLALALTCSPALTSTRLFASLMCLHAAVCLAAFGFLGYAPLLGNNSDSKSNDTTISNSDNYCLTSQDLLSPEQRQLQRHNRSISEGIFNREECLEALGLLFTAAWLVGQLMGVDLAGRVDRFAWPTCLAACLACLLTVAGFPALQLAYRLLCVVPQ